MTWLRHWRAHRARRATLHALRRINVTLAERDSDVPCTLEGCRENWPVEVIDMDPMHVIPLAQREPPEPYARGTHTICEAAAIYLVALDEAAE